MPRGGRRRGLPGARGVDVRQRQVPGPRRGGRARGHGTRSHPGPAARGRRGPARRRRGRARGVPRARAPRRRFKCLGEGSRAEAGLRRYNQGGGRGRGADPAARVPGPGDVCEDGRRIP